jgi:hypothetical protein
LRSNRSSFFINPPLRGPDEIAHFCASILYVRGELLSVTQIKAAGPIAVGLDRVSFIIFCLQPWTGGARVP